MRRELLLHGIGVSPGIAIGPVFIYQRFLPTYKERELTTEQIPQEIDRFNKAIKETEKELKRLKDEIRREMGRDLAELISVQLSLLYDPELYDATIKYIETQHRNAEYAFSQVLKKYIVPLNETKTLYFKERIADIMDVSSRVLRNILGIELPSIYEVSPGTIIIAHELLPSEAALLDKDRIVGVATEMGGKTSHTAIMTRAKEVPAVIGIENLIKKVKAFIPGVQKTTLNAIVDGQRGILILSPTEKRLEFYQNEIARITKQKNYLISLKSEEAITKDGKHIDISANIEFVAEAHSALNYGARGIGLFRTEYLFLARHRPITEDEQVEIYSDVARIMNPYPVIIRTFDLGGDKILPGYEEPNPYLGWRAIRLCLDNPELFLFQIKAILRASIHGNLKIMLPMISDLEELKRAKEFINRAKKELKEKNIPFDENIEIGIMVETPACALLAEHFATECNFFSIGSNDLTQYTLAVDRDNMRVAKLYNNLHPAVLNLIKNTISTGHRHGIWVGLCGEFASDPYGIIILLGMQIDELSMIPSIIPLAKKIVRGIDYEFAQTVSNEVLGMSTAEEVVNYINTKLTSTYPELSKFLAELEAQNYKKNNKI
ncbi:MAG: phosphoenolpyruvate--protein phosphotransferase [candidate division WOR-3 bacterium]